MVFEPRSIDGDLLVLSGSPTLRPASEVLAGKVVGFYFSASWCPPCRAFTPVLKEVYASIVGRGEAFEIVFVSSDRDESSFVDYARKMPWTAVPFSPRGAALRARLASAFGVRGIPRLVLVDPLGHVINSDARGAVLRDPKGERFPWAGEHGAQGGVEESTGALLKILAIFVACWLVTRWFLGGQ